MPRDSHRTRSWCRSRNYRTCRLRWFTTGASWKCARGQVQLDVFGPIAELVWQLLAECLYQVNTGGSLRQWLGPSKLAGLSQIMALGDPKTPPPSRPFKVMCWLAVDRGFVFLNVFLTEKTSMGTASPDYCRRHSRQGLARAVKCIYSGIWCR